MDVHEDAQSDDHTPATHPLGEADAAESRFRFDLSALLLYWCFGLLCIYIIIILYTPASIFFFFVLAMCAALLYIQCACIAGLSDYYRRRTGCDNVRFRSENNGPRQWTATAAGRLLYTCIILCIVFVCVRRRPGGAFKYLPAVVYLHFRRIRSFDFFSSFFILFVYFILHILSIIIYIINY